MSRTENFTEKSAPNGETPELSTNKLNQVFDQHFEEN